jgi:hypothetical protein
MGRANIGACRVVTCAILFACAIPAAGAQSTTQQELQGLQALVRQQGEKIQAMRRGFDEIEVCQQVPRVAAIARSGMKAKIKQAAQAAVPVGQRS